MVSKKITSELIYRSTDTLIILGIVLLASLYSQKFNIEGYLIAGLGASLIFGLVGRFTDIYTSWAARPFIRDEGARVTITWLTTFLLLIFCIFATKTSEQFSRVVLVSWLLVTPVLLIASRYALRRVLTHFKSLGFNNRTIAIAGLTEHGLQFAHSIESNPSSGLQIAGFYTTDTTQTHSNYNVLGDLDSMVTAAHSGEWDQIYLALPSNQSKVASKLISDLAYTITPIRLIPDEFTHSLLHSKYMEIIDTPVLCIYDTPLTRQDSLIKRIEDIILGLMILTLISPLLLLVSLAVKISSPGPIIFKQYRHGLRGEKFEVWKFRTMTVCENGNKVTQATRGDARITAIGAFLRKTSLDELPQFINVLQGHMSIVGPRPHAVAHNEYYKELIPGYMQRHLVKPGITGWAQVNGWRGETDTLYKMETRVELDMEYIRGWSLWLDLKIIFVTAFKTLNDKNAY